MFAISQQGISHLHWPRHLELCSYLTYSDALVLKVVNLRSRWQKWDVILLEGLEHTAFERKMMLIHSLLPILK